MRERGRAALGVALAVLAAAAVVAAMTWLAESITSTTVTVGGSVDVLAPTTPPARTRTVTVTVTQPVAAPGRGDDARPDDDGDEGDD